MEKGKYNKTRGKKRRSEKSVWVTSIEAPSCKMKISREVDIHTGQLNVIKKNEHAVTFYPK